MKLFSNLTLAAVLGLSLVGCSVFEDEDEALPELPVIQAKFNPTISWQEQVGDGVEHYFSRLRPVIYNDVVYAASREGTVSAFNFADGKTLWSVDLRDDAEAFFASKKSQRLSGGLSVAYGKLYIGTENGEVMALDLDDGKIIWRIKVQGEVMAEPVGGEGLLIVNTSAGHLIALHPDTGEKRWQFDQEVAPLTLRGISTPIVESGGVIFGRSDGKLCVVIAETGLEAWQQSVATAVGASELERLVDVDTKPVLSGSTVYALAYNGNLIASDVQSGRIKWKKEYSSYRNLAYDAGTLYLTDVSGNVYAVNAFDGKEQWQQTVLARRGLTDVYADGDYLVIGDNLGVIHWLDKSTGELVSRLELDDDGFFVGAVGERNKVVVMTRDGELSAIETP